MRLPLGARFFRGRRLVVQHRVDVFLIARQGALGDADELVDRSDDREGDVGGSAAEGIGF